MNYSRVGYSAIIPVFNVRPYLVQALDGVPQQTYNPIENIIIDDESNDGLWEIELKSTCLLDRYRCIRGRYARICGHSASQYVGVTRMKRRALIHDLFGLKPFSGSMCSFGNLWPIDSIRFLDCLTRCREILLIIRLLALRRSSRNIFGVKNLYFVFYVRKKEDAMEPDIITVSSSGWTSTQNKFKTLLVVNGGSQINPSLRTGRQDS